MAARIVISTTDLAHSVYDAARDGINEGWELVKGIPTKEHKLKESGRVKGDLITIGEAFDLLKAKDHVNWTFDAPIENVGNRRWFTHSHNVLRTERYKSILTVNTPHVTLANVQMMKRGYRTTMCFQNPLFLEQGLTVVEGGVRIYQGGVNPYELTDDVPFMQYKLHGSATDQDWELTKEELMRSEGYNMTFFRPGMVGRVKAGYCYAVEAMADSIILWGRVMNGDNGLQAFYSLLTFHTHSRDHLPLLRAVFPTRMVLDEHWKNLILDTTNSFDQFMNVDFSFKPPSLGGPNSSSYCRIEDTLGSVATETKNGAVVSLLAAIATIMRKMRGTGRLHIMYVEARNWGFLTKWCQGYLGLTQYQAEHDRELRGGKRPRSGLEVDEDQE